MQITTRATVLAVALLASAPLLAAGFGPSMAGTNAPTQAAQAPTKQDNCTPPAPPPTDLSPEKLASFLPKPGSTPPEPPELDRGLIKAGRCARASGLRAPGEGPPSRTTDAMSNRATATQPSSSTGL